MESFLSHFNQRSDVEREWLRQLFAFVRDKLCPVLGTGALALSLVQRIEVAVGSSRARCLPLSYRLVTISELVTRQQTPCCSNLSWSTNEHREWVREAEQALPNLRALPRANLLLIGCLSGGCGVGGSCDGFWRVEDVSGSLTSEMLSPSPLWLGQPLLFPFWNYIPQTAPGQDHEDSGYLELVGCPLPLTSDSEVAFNPAGVNRRSAVGVKVAAGLLKHRVKGLRVKVYGEVCAVCPLLDIAGNSFFCLFLREEQQTLPILVTEPSCLWWRLSEESGCVSALPDRQLEGADETERVVPPHTTKHSRVISYKGMLTSVRSTGAGLYVIDGKIGLCLAYQPIQRHGLRPGAEIELHDVHFLYRPSHTSLPSMLCMCLRSSLRITSFSRLGSEVSSTSNVPSDALLPQLLLEMNLGMSQYLWLCYCCTALRDRLVPRWVRGERVCVLAGRLLECVLTWEEEEEERGGAGRDIYREMLQEPHHCPLTEYRVGSPGCQYVSVSDCISTMESECWDSLSLSSLLPASGSSLTQAELNPALAWSVSLSLGQDKLPRPLLLVGVLDLPRTHTPVSGPHTLCLRDQTGILTCVAVETSDDDDSGRQRAISNTAWIGCLVCVRRFTMVMERFLQSEFPSYRHLDQDNYITHRHSRVYVQLCLNDLQILSPSASMTHLIREKKRRREEEEEDDQMEVQEEEEGGSVKRARQEVQENEPRLKPPVAIVTGSSLPGELPCVSLVIRVLRKEGVAWRNEGTGCEGGRAGLSLCFSVKAEPIGQVQKWAWNPRNSVLQERETDRKTDSTTVEVLFLRSSVRWFNLIQPGSFYRLIAPNTQDSSVLIGCLVAVKSGVELHATPSLLVQSDWTIHTLIPPLLNPPYSQMTPPPVMSVGEVLNCSRDVELVSFYGVISQRITLPDQSGTPETTQNTDVEAGLSVRLTVCSETKGRSLQVYLDLSHTPYPPGIVPGNAVLFSGFQRRLSRVGGVYCRSLLVSCLTVSAVGTTILSRDPPPPVVLLGVWAMRGAEQCLVGRVKGHVVCVLYLQLQWTCSLCGSIYTQRCTRSHPPCGSTSSVFQAVAKAVIEDGSGEAHVWFSCPVVSCLLGLTTPQWEGLQRSLRTKGHLRVYTRGRSLVSDTVSDDPLLQYLSCVCNSIAVCRPLTLTCTLQTRSHTPAARREDSAQLKRGEKRKRRGSADLLTHGLTQDTAPSALFLHFLFCLSSSPRGKG
ncbi:hypothetical protein DPEC_G00106800 [Dallia pectoralis]|uniref:Uncharacterized protein n=1 Tax=Dallia pectoralis TaxID=75939 RepID=A0ACC2GXZ0_DALPE|nr:hypothetical protein DPEC_G00106800 [Dallia pectoralis]